MAHSLAGVAKWGQVQLHKDVLPQRPSLLRVSAPRLEQVESSPPDEVPVTRARYTAGAFAPPAKLAAPSDKARTTSPSRSGVQHSPQLRAADGPFQRTVPMTDKQLEEFSTSVLGSSSSVWSAEARNRPASTSDSVSELEESARGEQKSVREWSSVLAQLCFRGDLEAALRLLQELDKSVLQSVTRRFRHKLFLGPAAESLKSKAAVQFAKLVALHQSKPEVLVTDALQVCAKSRDIDSGHSLVEWARKNGVRVDTKMLTTLITVCKSVGNVDRAFKLYQEMRSGNHRMDAHVIGALIATHAEAMKRDMTVAHERKDQYVLLERAFQLVEDADKAAIPLTAPVWNALIMCAGRSGEIHRAFHALSMMQRRGADADAVTYGSLIESCVCAGHTEQALRVYEVALQKGFVLEVKLYTAALSACMRPMPSAWERAMDIYAAMQRAAVRPDKKFFACLISVAGRCGRLDTAFELLGEMAAEGIRPSATSVSALIHACLDRENLPLARRVYDLCAKQGVYPVLSQFNRLMDVYASESRFGEVVSLLGDMVAAGRQPNLNTYRILINACAFTDQGGLAFQVFALMHANRVRILQDKFAHTIYYMLVKACFNQTRFLWTPAGYPPIGPLDAPPPEASVAGPEALGSSGGIASSRQADSAGASTSGAGLAYMQQQQQGYRTSPFQLGTGAAAPAAVHHHTHHPAGPPPERRQEAEKLLAALGASKLKRGAHQSDPFEGPPDAIDWPSHAISAFHHMLNCGYKPTLELLDLLLNCMRAKMLPLTDPEAPDAGGLAGRGPAAARSQFWAPFVPRRSRNEEFEVAFENRAFVIMEEAINRGLLPRYDLDGPLVVDMRRMPPVVSEVYVLHILATLERRDLEKKAKAAKAAAAATGAPGAGTGLMAAAAAVAKAVGQSYHHPITLLVPPFDPDHIKWPSYLERLLNRYMANLHPEEQAMMRQRYRRRSRISRRRLRSRPQLALLAGANRQGPSPDGRGPSPHAAANGAAATNGQSSPDTLAHGSAVNGVNGPNGHTNGVNGANGHNGPAHTVAASEAVAPVIVGPVVVGVDDMDVAALTEDRYIDGALHDPWDDAQDGDDGETAAAGMYGWAEFQSEEEDSGTDPAGGRYVADNTTGVAVAATLQRMKVWMDMDYLSGTITVAPTEVMSFLKRRRLAAATAAAAVMAEERAADAAARGATASSAAAGPGAGGPTAPGAAPGGVPPSGNTLANVTGGSGLAAAMAATRILGIGGRGLAGSLVEQQQRNIRLGMSSPAGAAGPSGHFQHSPPPAASRFGSGSAAGSAAGSASNGAGNGAGDTTAAAGSSGTDAAGGPRSSRPPSVQASRGSSQSSRPAWATSGPASPSSSLSPQRQQQRESAMRPLSVFRRGDAERPRRVRSYAESRRRSDRDAAADDLQSDTAGPSFVPGPENTYQAAPADATGTNGSVAAASSAQGHHASAPAPSQQLQPRPQRPQQQEQQQQSARSDPEPAGLSSPAVTPSHHGAVHAPTAEESDSPGHPMVLSMASSVPAPLEEPETAMAGVVATPVPNA